MSSKKKAPVREIPGFYYDEDKRRYFKITKDFPRKPAFSREKNQMAENENFTKTKPKKRSMSIVILVAKQEVRPLSTMKLQRSHRKTKLESIDFNSQCAIRLHVDGWEGRVNICKLITNKTEDRVVIVSKTHGSDFSFLQSYDIKSRRLSIELCSPFDIFANYLTSVSMAQHYDNKTDHLLVSTVNGKVGNFFLSKDSVVRQYTRRFNYIQHHTWTSCLVPDPSRNVLLPAIGINGGVLMADNDFSWRPLLRTTKSDVLALAYNHHTHCLYSGSRDRTIHCFDARQPKRHASVAKAKSSVDNIKQLESSEFLFLISTLAGHVELWDSRGFKPVISYPGHNNSHSMLQLHLDGNEEFVASVGEDCVTRIWELRNANLINSLPSIRFDKCDKPVMPAIAFIGGNMLPSTTRGLLYAIQDDVYFKSL